MLVPSKERRQRILDRADRSSDDRASGTQRNPGDRSRVLHGMDTTRPLPTRRWPGALLPVLIGALLVACGATTPGATDAPPDVSASDRPARTDAPADRVDASSPAAVIGEVPEAILGPILDDAAAATGLDPADIEVVRAESVTWPDGSLGCPEPGMMYTQALVDGYQVVLDADGEELDYRVGESGAFRICVDSGTPSGG
jgi:hypothetical protein